MLQYRILSEQKIRIYGMCHHLSALLTASILSYLPQGVVSGPMEDLQMLKVPVVVTEGQLSYSPQGQCFVSNRDISVTAYQELGFACSIFHTFSMVQTTFNHGES